MKNVTAQLKPSPIRRLLAVTMMALLGGFLIYIGLTRPSGSLWAQAFLLAAGGLALFLGEQLRRATALTIDLADGRITDSSGRELCRLDEIRSVDRGTFAFKPSNGFLIVLKDAKPRAWAPGLWWRLGRRIGIGGVTPARQAKAMVEAIAHHLNERAEEQPSG